MVWRLVIGLQYSISERFYFPVQWLGPLFLPDPGGSGSYTSASVSVD